jgi:Flp pilus assembly protein TadD
MNDRVVLRLSLLLFAVTVVIYSPVVNHQFLDFDDAPYVTANPHVSSGFTAANFGWAWTSIRASNWHPLTWLSHMLDCQLFGLNAGAHHFVSLMFHALSTVALFWALRGLTREAWRPAWVAALFALHPLHVESVAWVAERKDVLSTLLGILCLGAYAFYAKRPNFLRYLPVTAFFGLSLLAKPMLVTLPFLLLLLDYWPLRRISAGARWGRLIAEKIPLMLVAAASCVVTVLAQRAGHALLADRLPLGARLANAALAYVIYLRRALWPSDLAIFYPYSRFGLPWSEVIGAVILLAILTGLAVAFRRRFPAFLVGWLWFVGTLVPVIGVVQVGAQAMADRYAYFPIIGLFIAAAWIVPAPRSQRACGWLATTALTSVAACAVATWIQLGYWRDDAAAWQRDLQVTADNALGEHNLGVTLYRQGRVDEAEEHLTRAVELSPNFTMALNNLGTCYLREGRVDEASALFLRALAADAEQALSHSNLGLALMRKRRTAEASEQFREAAALAPEVAEYRYNLAAALKDEGKTAEASAIYRQAVELEPRWPQMARLLADSLLKMRNPKMRCPPEAVFRARQACEATAFRQPDMLATLANAYAELGDPSKAVATARRAMELAQANRDQKLIQQLSRDISTYEALLAHSEALRTRATPSK